MEIGWVEVLASSVLVIVAIGLSFWKGLDVHRSLVISSVRAAIQLLAVGVVFQLIFASSTALIWAFVWVAAMTIVSVETVRRRAPEIPNVRRSAFAALGGALLVSLSVLFGLGVFDLEPVTLVVIAGITLGNTLPSAVLGLRTAVNSYTEHPARVEGLLSLGLDRAAVSRFMTPGSIRTALIPQIERTKVIGLIALPGSMTGMLLAGADAFDAVMVQIVIVYLVLGSVAVGVAGVVTMVASRALTPDLRLESWVRR